MPDAAAPDPHRLVAATLVPRVGDRSTLMVRLTDGQPPPSIDRAADGEYVLSNSTPDAPKYRRFAKESMR